MSDLLTASLFFFIFFFGERRRVTSSSAVHFVSIDIQISAIPSTGFHYTTFLLRQNGRLVNSCGGLPYRKFERVFREKKNTFHFLDDRYTKVGYSLIGYNHQPCRVSCTCDESFRACEKKPTYVVSIMLTTWVDSFGHVFASHQDD